MEISTVHLSIPYLSSASVHVRRAWRWRWHFGYACVCLYWFTAGPGHGYIRALGKLVRSLTRLSGIYHYYYFCLNEDSSHVGTLSSLISRRETRDATSDITKRLATAVVWHVSCLGEFQRKLGDTHVQYYSLFFLYELPLGIRLLGQ